MKIDLARGARTGTLIKASKKAGLSEKWAATPIAKKLAKRSLRAGLTDLQRFQVMINRKQRSQAIKKKIKLMAKGQKKGAAPAKGAGKPAAKGKKGKK